MKKISFPLRMSTELHQKVAEAAQRLGISMNAVLLLAVQEGLSPLPSVRGHGDNLDVAPHGNHGENRTPQAPSGDNNPKPFNPWKRKPK